MPVTTDDRTVRQPRKVELQAAMAVIGDQGVAENEDPRVTPDTISPERLQLADAGILHLSPIVRQLIDLWKEPEEEDYGRLRPTRDAFDMSVRLLVDAAIEAYHQQRQIPSGCASTDSEGGVRIEWVRPGASVHLVVPAEENRVAYVYHQVGNDYATEDVTPERLAYWLRRIE
jgi:hypothetical protein